MNVPLGLALAELIAETNIPTIAHHHDFYWERDRFAVNAARDFLHAAFPPAIPSICHIVINSYAATELARRAGMRSYRIPNVMDWLFMVLFVLTARSGIQASALSSADGWSSSPAG